MARTAYSLVFGAVRGMLYLYALPLAMVAKPRHEQLFALPANVLRVVSGQFKEISADMSFLNALTWLGGSRTQPDTGRYLPRTVRMATSNPQKCGDP